MEGVTVIGQLGDVNPVDYGGGLVVRNDSLERVQVVYFEVLWEEDPYEELDPGQPDHPPSRSIYVFDIDKLAWNGISGWYSARTLAHEQLPRPRSEYVEWFASSDAIKRMANAVGVYWLDLAGMFCSDDPMERAKAYEEIGLFHGFGTLDTNPELASYSRALELFNNLKGGTK